MIEISTYRQVYKVPSVLNFRLKLGSRFSESEHGCVGWGSGKSKSILCWEIGSDSGYSDFDFGDEKTKLVYVGVDGSLSCSDVLTSTYRRDPITGENQNCFLEGEIGVELRELSLIIYKKLGDLRSDVLDYNLNDAIHFVFSDLVWIRERKLGLLL